MNVDKETIRNDLACDEWLSGYDELVIFRKHTEELLGALEAAQAEKAEMKEQYARMAAEQDAVQEENTRLRLDNDEIFGHNTTLAGINEALRAEVDRLTNQITDLRLYLDKVANTAFGSNSAGLRLLRAEARDLLARCSPNEETAEEKK